MRAARPRIGLAVALGILAAFWSDHAVAYRPFDGTDAAVAERGTAEIELGPAEYVRQGDERLLIAPNVRLNYGFAEGWEAVLEGQTSHRLSEAARHTSQVENGFFVKRVLREGVLQDKYGPSIAAEFGVLLPGINDQRGTGGSIAGIVSQRWKAVTVHFNAAAAVSRDRHADLFLSTILEGRRDWPVRPVAEIAYEREFGRAQVESALIGAIWQARDDLAVDFGLRGGRDSGHALAEIRAGLTFSFPIASTLTSGGHRFGTYRAPPAR